MLIGAVPAAAADAPLNAIPWLSESLVMPEGAAPTPAEPRAAVAPPSAPISVQPLGRPSRDATGLYPAASVGLSDALWSNAEPEALLRLIAATPLLELPAARRLLTMLMLVEAAPPPGMPPDALLLARVDALLTRGALDPARALIDRAGPVSPALFRRLFDTALLAGNETRACDTLAASLELSASFEARVFCLARAGRWETAALTLEVAAALGRIPPANRDLLARFLDPDLFEGAPQAPQPEPMTPLQFRLLEAVGDHVPTGPLPLAFAQSDLRHIVGWKAQVEAGERLARAGVLDPNTLLGLYTARAPSASGGVWDRVAAIRALDTGLAAGDVAGTAQALEAAMAAMHHAGLDVPLAQMMAPRLARMALPPAATSRSYELALISDGGEAFLPPPAGLDLPQRLRVAAALAAGMAPAASARPALAAALHAGISAEPGVPALAPGDTGTALLEALRHLRPGPSVDPDDAERALKALRRAGFETLARHAALQIWLLDDRG